MLNKMPSQTLSATGFCRRSLFSSRNVLMRAINSALASPALPSATEELRDNAKGGLAPLGGQEIESTSAFVQGYQNLIGKHYRGHADITRDAFRLLSGSESVSSEAGALLVRASQTPDLFRWGDGRYHAHTPEYDVATVGAKQQSLAEGQEQFIGLMCTLMGELSKHANEKRFDVGLIVAGPRKVSSTDRLRPGGTSRNIRASSSRRHCFGGCMWRVNL